MLRTSDPNHPRNKPYNLPQQNRAFEKGTPVHVRRAIEQRREQAALNKLFEL
ncbi:hypothetical protein [Enterovibrio norvegicus]|uniref:hypothetical protein n=1 Tax=Enterovibrio norvegicus TaxID=188144 RepID=UPI0002D81DE6|nr:hypothetical protein [Enterovibrio norvegicus]